jgi:hypothetical protein
LLLASLLLSKPIFLFLLSLPCSLDLCSQVALEFLLLASPAFPVVISALAENPRACHWCCCC